MHSGYFSNSEDPDEMPHNAALHQGLHCLLRQNRSSEKELKYILEIITYGPSIYTTDHPDYCMEIYGKFQCYEKGYSLV